MLLSDLDRLEDEVNDLKSYRDLYYERDKEKAIIQEKLNSSVSKEILYALSISLGATLIGLSPSLLTTQNQYGQIILGCGIVLILGGLTSKFFWK